MSSLDRHYSVAVVIPCYNHGQFLLEAIASVEEEPEVVCELVIVNDGSIAPVTLEILTHLRQQGYKVFDIENQGLSNARNYGIQQTSSRYVLPLDADNKLEPGFLKGAVEILDTMPQVGIVYGDRCVFGQQNQRVELAPFSVNRLLLGNYIDACALFRRQVWEDVGGYDLEIPDQLGYEDWDFWLGAVEAGWKFFYLDQVSFWYRSRPGSMVSGCNLPENRKRLFEYICSKHTQLYASQFSNVFSTKEAQRLDALEEAFQYSQMLAEMKAEREIYCQERDQWTEENQVLRQRLNYLELAILPGLEKQREEDKTRFTEAIAQAQYWENEHGRVLEELNRLRHVHRQLLTGRWWRFRAKLKQGLRRLIEIFVKSASSPKNDN